MHDYSMDTSLAETSMLPGSFPGGATNAAATVTTTPRREDPHLLQQNLDSELSFIPYNADDKMGEEGVSTGGNEVLPRSPAFNFKVRKAIYPSLDPGSDAKTGDSHEGKENSETFGFHFEENVLDKKKFSHKLSSKVLQELDSRINMNTGYNDTGATNRNSLQKKLFSPRSAIGMRIARDVKSPRNRRMRSLVKNDFNAAHNKNFNKMDSINNHYSVHQQMQQQQQQQMAAQKAREQKQDDRIVRKKRRTLLGPEDIMEQASLNESHEGKKSLDPRQRQEMGKPSHTRTLDPRQRPSASTRPSVSSTSTTNTQQAQTSAQRKFSFLKPTASSLSKSISNFDIPSSASTSTSSITTSSASSGGLRKSSTMHFKSSIPTSSYYNQHTTSNNSAGTLRKSTTMSNINLNTHARQSSVIYRPAKPPQFTDIQGHIPRTTSFQTSGRPTWR